MSINIASIDSISEVNMVSNTNLALLLLLMLMLLIVVRLNIIN